MEKFEKFELDLKWFSGFIGETNLKYTENGKCKCTFSIPLKQNKEDSPTWLNVTCWGKLAEEVSEIEKGKLVVVGGVFSENEYNGKKYLNFGANVVIEC